MILPYAKIHTHFSDETPSMIVEPRRNRVKDREFFLLQKFRQLF